MCHVDLNSLEDPQPTDMNVNLVQHAEIMYVYREINIFDTQHQEKPTPPNKMYSVPQLTSSGNNMKTVATSKAV